MSKSPASQTVTQRLDPAAERYRNYVYQQAQNVASQPYQSYGGPRVAGATPQFMQGLGMATDPSALQGYAGATGNLGFGAAGLQGLAGQQAPQLAGTDLTPYLNPYQQQVVNQTQQAYDRMRQASGAATNDLATRSGAFGGARHGVAQGQALGDIARQEGQTMANLYSQGFGQAQGAAQQDIANQMARYGQQAGIYGNLANLGMGALGGQLGAQGQLGQAGMAGGDYLRSLQQAGMDVPYQEFLNRQNWGARQLGMLQGPLGGPVGSAQTSTQQNASNPFATLLGIGGAFLGGPLGGLLGGGLGSLFGGK